LATLKAIGTKVPLKVYEMWQEYCKEQGKTSYEKLQEIIANELKIDLERGWVIKPKSTQERKDK